MENQFLVIINRIRNLKLGPIQSLFAIIQEVKPIRRKIMENARKINELLYDPKIYYEPDIVMRQKDIAMQELLIKILRKEQLILRYLNDNLTDSAISIINDNWDIFKRLPIDISMRLFGTSTITATDIFEDLYNSFQKEYH